MTEEQMQRLLDRIDRLERIVREQQKAVFDLTRNDPMSARHRLNSVGIDAWILSGSRETRERSTS